MPSWVVLRCIPGAKNRSPMSAGTISDSPDAASFLGGHFFVLLEAKAVARVHPEITDGYERVENFKSSLAVLRRILGLWRRSMYSNTSTLAASSVGYVMR